MKIYITITLLSLLLIPNISNSQTLIFCDDVDELGNAKLAANKFAISKDGGYLTLLVQFGTELNKDEIYFEIYKVNTKGKEQYESTIYHSIEPNSKYTSKQVAFKEPGTYNIYVYTGDGIYLTSGSLKIEKK